MKKLCSHFQILKLLAPILILSLMLAGCQFGSKPPIIPAVTEEITENLTEEIIEETETVAETATEESIDPPVEEIDAEDPYTHAEGLPADPQPVTFTASDDQVLNGTFYPAERTNMPIVVLMHWYPGDEHDWDAIARWLQMRGLLDDFEAKSQPWLNPAWFPERVDGTSLNVLTFTFRNCEGKCKAWQPEGWLKDAEAAMKFAAQLEGVDSQRVIAVGASIGADAAVMGCVALNHANPITCGGAFSLSPGGYLQDSYAGEVALLQEVYLGAGLVCLASPSEAEPCEAVSANDFYQSLIIPNGGHGMELFNPEHEQNVLEVLIHFLISYFPVQ